MATKYTITLSADDWYSMGGVTSPIYLSGGAFYEDSALTVQLGSLGGYTREGYRFTGFFSATSGGTQYTTASGSFTNAAFALTSNKTWYAQGQKLSCSLILDGNGGSGGTQYVYTKTGTAEGEPIYYSNAGCTTQITPTPPTRTGYVFLGFFSAASGGTQYTDADMNPTAALRALTTDGRIYAQWQAPYKVTLSASGWTGADAAFWYDAIGGKCYAAANMATEITTVAVPTKESRRFNGYNTASDGTGTTYIDAQGNISADIGAYVTAAKTLYAQGVVVSYKITTAQAGGTGGGGVFYAAAGETGAGRFHTDDQCTSEPKTSAAIPTRTGYTFLGYYSAASGGTKYVESTGEFTEAFYSAAISAAITITAHWQARQYTLSFDYNGGRGTPAAKTVTYGSAIGALPTATNPKGAFVEWQVDGVKITSATVWNIAANMAAVAKWDYYFSGVTDYFNLGSATLIPFESDEGTNRAHVVTRHYGKAAGAEQTGPVWRNPTVKYMVVGNMTFTATLGKAVSATRGLIYGPYYDGNPPTWHFGYHAGMTHTGHMITSVTIETGLGRFPVVTVHGTANEGADAINKFTVSVPIVARARPQNLLNSITGGGYLQSLVLSATCDPVVMQENLEPCASDVVNGRYELHAETLAASLESAPTCTGGFVALGEPAVRSGTNYMRYRLTARKEIV